MHINNDDGVVMVVVVTMLVTLILLQKIRYVRDWIQLKVKWFI